MGPAPILHLQDVSYTLGGRPLFDKANLSVTQGERICLIGRNGSGKSTLLKIAAGQLLPDSGSVFLQPGITLRYLPQEPDLSSHKTVAGYVQSCISDPTDLWRATALLEAIGLKGDKETAHLSGGEIRRCAIAGVLAAAPDVLLLDEPTNHLDLPTIDWLEKELLSLKCAIIIISHDHRLLSALSRSVVWLDRGLTRRLDQGFDRFEEWRENFLEQESRDAHKLDRQIEREEDWMRYGVTARRKRNVRRVAELADLRKKRSEAVRVPGNLTFDTLSAGTSSKLVVVAENISKSWGERSIVRNLDLRILRGDRLAIIGANGAGKTTLLRMLTGEETPDTGTITLGPSLSMASLDQKREMLDPEKTLSNTLTGGGDMIQIGSEKRHVIGYMKEFLFRPEQARTPVSALSGGERGRLMLACILSQPSNFLVLDEPTNDLDLETLDLLQDMLATYPGTVLLISHDRDFIDRVATSVLTTDGKGTWTEYVGGYSSMQSQLKTDVSQESPTAITSSNTGVETTAPRSSSKKLNYKDQYRLSQLPQEIAALEHKKSILRSKLEDADLYRKNPEQFQKYSSDLEKTETLLSRSEEEWLSLELKKEELENN